MNSDVRAMFSLSSQKGQGQASGRTIRNKLEDDTHITSISRSNRIRRNNCTYSKDKTTI